MENENTAVRTATPTSFWVIAGLILIWNLFGVFHYLNSVNATVESLVAPGMTTEHTDFFLNVPSYHMAVFALGVRSGFLGAALWLLRKAWVVPPFLFSAVMVIASFVLDTSAVALLASAQVTWGS